MNIKKIFLSKIQFLVALKPLVIQTHYLPHFKPLFYSYQKYRWNCPWHYHRCCHFSKKNQINYLTILYKIRDFANCDLKKKVTYSPWYLRYIKILPYFGKLLVCIFLMIETNFTYWKYYGCYYWKSMSTFFASPLMINFACKKLG